MTADSIYVVCAGCAHVVLVPEKPARCENCRRDHSWLDWFYSCDDAEARSDEVLAHLGITRAEHESAVCTSAYRGSRRAEIRGLVAVQS